MGCAHAKGGNTDFYAIQENFKNWDDLCAGLRKCGLESSQLILGIDCSKSNNWSGIKSYRRNLHDLSTETPYEKIIRMIGPIIEEFDDDKIIPAYRFGCLQTRNHSVLPLATAGAAECEGWQGVLRAYRQAIPHIHMSGPTTMAPLIHQAIEIVRRTREYHILLILTDGDITSRDRDAEAVIAASAHPISIIAIGIGDGPFAALEEFDDELPRRRFDNFQFVNFTALERTFAREECPDLKLATHILMEVPEQYFLIKRLGYI